MYCRIRSCNYCGPVSVMKARRVTKSIGTVRQVFLSQRAMVLNLIETSQ